MTDPIIKCQVNCSYQIKITAVSFTANIHDDHLININARKDGIPQVFLENKSRKFLA